MFIWHIDSPAQRTALIIITVFTLLAGLAVAARLWARSLQRLSLAANDFVLLIALLCTCGIATCEVLAILLGGVGVHQDVVASTNPQSLTIFGILVFIIQILWPIAQGLVKASMCLLYVAVFPGGRFRATALAVMSFCLMFSLCIVIITVVICIPASAQWDPTTPGAACGDRIALWLWGGILNVVTDAMVICLPMPMVWKLYIPRGKKLMLTGLFGIGALVTIVSIVRLHSVLSVDFSLDTTYTVTNAAIWSLVESALAITAACLPVAGPALRYLVPDFLAQRWTYIRTSPAPDSNNRQSTRDSAPLDLEANTADLESRNTGEWFGRPCATRAPTPHPIAMLEKAEKSEEITEKLPALTTKEIQEETVVDSMERGEGIMVKVEWEVTSNTRASWPMTRINSRATSEAVVEAEGSEKMAGA